VEITLDMCPCEGIGCKANGEGRNLVCGMSTWASSYHDRTMEVLPFRAFFTPALNLADLLLPAVYEPALDTIIKSKSEHRVGLISILIRLN